MHITADITFHLHDTDTSRILAAIQHLKETIMASNADLLAALNTVNGNITDIGTEVDKIGTEVQSLQTNVQTLTDQLANVQTTPEVDAALAAVQASAGALAAKVKAVDDLVPDQPVTP